MELFRDLSASDEGIVVRSPNQSDVGALWKIGSDPTSGLAAWFGGTHAEFSLARAEDILTQALSPADGRYGVVKFVELRVQPKIVGLLTLSPPRNRTTEICYWVSANFRNQGIASRALRLTIAEIFSSDYAVDRVEALIDVDNLPSRAVARHSGFVDEGAREVSSAEQTGGAPWRPHVFSLERH